jgi:hypothetical protein
MKREQFNIENNVSKGVHESGYQVEIRYDDFATPSDIELIGKFAHTHKRADFGIQSELVSHERIEELEADDGLITVSVYVYDHSGMTVSATPFSCPWDSGKVGVMYAAKGIEDLTDEQIRESLLSEIKIYDMWLTNDIWQILIIDPFTKKVVESLCSVFGFDDACESVEEIIPKAEFNLCDASGYICESVETTTSCKEAA